MVCENPNCRLNDEFLSLLPSLNAEDQQRMVARWPVLDAPERERLLQEMRALSPDGTDLMALAKLANYFQCGVVDMVRYTRQEPGVRSSG